MIEPAMTDDPVAGAVERDLGEAARAFFPDAAKVSAIGERRSLARVETPGGEWSVRRWPAGTARERMLFIHRLLAEGLAAGVGFLPRVATLPGPLGGAVLERGGALYDAQSWLPGCHPRRGAATGGRAVYGLAAFPGGSLMAVAADVARWHHSSWALARDTGAPQALLDGVLQSVRLAWLDGRQRLRPVAAPHPEVQRWLRLGEQVMDAAGASLAQADFLRSQRPVIGHLNLWPHHVLFSHLEGIERLSGLLDFASAAVCSPLLDLAQLVTHFGGWTGEAAEDALSAYGRVAPLTPEERRLLPAVAGIDLVAAAGRLLVLAFARSTGDQGAPIARARVEASALVQSLEALTPAVVRGDRPTKPRRRPWVQRPPRHAGHDSNRRD